MRRIFIFSTLIIIGFTGCEKEQGCTNISACNFSPSAEEDDGTCYEPGDSCDDSNSNTVNDIYNSNCNCEGEPIDNGCTDDSACNYNSSANTDDGSCLYVGESCDDEDESTMNDIVNNNCICEGIEIVFGCIDDDACNYNNLANVEDNSCLYPGDSCNDGSSETINDLFNSNCDCEGDLLGCINANACNFNPYAVVDDGSCYYPGNSCNDGDASTFEDMYNDNCECTGYVCEPYTVNGIDYLQGTFYGQFDSSPHENGIFIYRQDIWDIVEPTFEQDFLSGSLEQNWHFYLDWGIYSGNSGAVYGSSFPLNNQIHDYVAVVYDTAGDGLTPGYNQVAPIGWELSCICCAAGAPTYGGDGIHVPFQTFTVVQETNSFIYQTFPFSLLQ